MSNYSLLELQYPIGEHIRSAEVLTQKQRADYIQAIKDLPELVQRSVSTYSETRLDTPYRPEGWTVRQLIHHLGDSHINGFVRFKFALTEENPTIKAYNEKLWAATPEVYSVPVSVTLKLLEALHVRWAALLKSMKDEDFRKTFQHPVSGIMTLDQALALYAWHGKHHVTHILRLNERNNWQ